MEKLIELLNEFEKEKEYNKAEWKVSENNQLHYKYVVSDTPNWEWFSKKYLSRDVSKAYLISYECGFIKWLVENDKIDLAKVYEKIWKPQIIMYEEWSKEEELCEIIWVNERDYYEDIIMLLSISDTPIEDLLLYLK